MRHEQQDSSEALCPWCGAEAVSRLIDEDKGDMEIVCADCGRFEVSRVDVTEAELELALAGGRR
jgi:uncharacterized Zn finger protein